jgi:hypothetical protein
LGKSYGTGLDGPCSGFSTTDFGGLAGIEARSNTTMSQRIAQGTATDLTTAWTDNDIPEHPLNAARGILIGLALSTLIWAAILYGLWAALS